MEVAGAAGQGVAVEGLARACGFGCDGMGVSGVQVCRKRGCCLPLPPHVAHLLLLLPCSKRR